MTPAVLVVGGGMRLAVDMQGAHVHSCPECYEHVPCEQTCAVEVDLTLDDGTPRGGFCVCDRCLSRGSFLENPL